ncbi:HU family DNA-binding protein [Pelagibacteraceae bacterium]|nr:HU family DNA-binding protein [Pelagibacteraceae bacterium]
MSKKKIIDQLKKKNPKLNKLIIENILDTFVSSITGALTEKKTIELRKFGTFFLKEISEKKNARNPKTGELIYIPKKNKLRFKPSKELKKLINE